MYKTYVMFYKIFISPGGYSGFEVTGMIDWGQKSKPKKISGPKFNPPKIPYRISEP